MKKLLLLLLLIFPITSCAIFKSEFVWSWGNAYQVEDTLAEAICLDLNETYQLDIRKQFKDAGITISKFTLKSSDEKILKVKNEKITALSLGEARVYAMLFDKEKAEKYSITVAYTYIVDETKMTEIHSAEDLIDINNDLDGKYILKDNIDLKDYNWTAIGDYGLKGFDGYFSGFLINPYGYKISNLSSNENRDEWWHFGLFVGTYHAYISGLILENIFINNTSKMEIGGISADDYDSLFINCQVDGEISTGSSIIGGIVGASSSSRIVNCEFGGSLSAIFNNDLRDYPYIGGIVGYYYGSNNFSGIIGANVDADIFSVGGITGGIVGYVAYSKSLILNTNFSGTIIGKYTGEIFGYLVFSDNIEDTFIKSYKITPNDYGYEEQYYFEELSEQISANGLTFDTKRLRTGYIDKEHIVLSPKREGAGNAYIEYSFNTPVYQIDIELAFWSEQEEEILSAVIEYQNNDGEWLTKLDLLNDITLSEDRENMEKYFLNFRTPITKFRVYTSSLPAGTNNKGRICIGNLTVYRSIGG